MTSEIEKMVTFSGFSGKFSGGSNDRVNSKLMFRRMNTTRPRQPHATRKSPATRMATRSARSAEFGRIKDDASVREEWRPGGGWYARARTRVPRRHAPLLRVSRASGHPLTMHHSSRRTLPRSRRSSHVVPPSREHAWQSVRRRLRSQPPQLPQSWSTDLCHSERETDQSSRHERVLQCFPPAKQP